MIFESLKVENIMGCNYEIEFDPRYTVIIGDNRQGKTLTARLIMLALYGTGTRERDLHSSWKLRNDELLPISDKGIVELVFKSGDRRYKIYREFGRGRKVEFYAEKEGAWILNYRTDSDVKTGLEEDAGITPGLMNVVMSNEQSLIGAISYDDKLQSNVWDGWRWRTEIIRGNIKKAGNKCTNERRTLRTNIESSQADINSITNKWLKSKVFSESELEERINKEMLDAKLNSIGKGIEDVKEKIKHYREFHEKLIKLDDLENKTVTGNIIKICMEKKKYLDEKEDIDKLKTKCEKHSKTLTKVSNEGGEEGIRNKIIRLEDEEKKLSSAKGLKDREEKPFRVECSIYPPEKGERLVIEIPDDVATKFKFEQIADGGIAVPYDEGKEKKTADEKKKLDDLINIFNKEMTNLKDIKGNLRDEVGEKKDKLADEKGELDEQKTILESDKDRYLKIIEDIEKKEKMAKRLDIAKKWLEKLYDALSEEESLRKIRKETVAFINRIYETVYGWDINSKLEEEDKIIITDPQGKVRSHPSGSEIHIMGLAWRWMISRGFNLPLVLDELDVLLDEKNFDRTRRLIEEEMDRQTVILTLKEALKDLPGKIYKIVREEGISNIVEMK
ncbi:MAG: hypothetical protein ACFE95_07665 [Candidatus Hodarchaeota archaeon]